MLVAVAVVLLIHGVSSAWCPDACTCDRFTTGEREVSCRSGDGILMIRMYTSGNVRFECSNASAELYSMLKGLDVGPASNLQLVLCPLPPVPFLNFTKAIGAESLSSLLFQSFQNLTNSLAEDHFQGLKNLTRLRLYNNGFTDIPSNLLKGLTMLTHLEFRDNFLRLPSDLFDEVPQLKSLDLGNNRLQSLDPDLFQGLTSMKSLYLWGNRIERLDDQIFENLTTLEFLDLQSNYLEDLPNDIFRDCTSLKIVNLSKNNFTALPQGLFSNSFSLEVVRLTDNLRNMSLPSKLFADLPELKSVHLTKSKLIDLPEDLFNGSITLTNLSLSGNLFTTFPESLFKDQVGLTLLDLSYNSLERLPDRFFRNLLSLKTLLLHHNRFSRISRDLFRGLRGLKELNMEYNQLVWIDNSAFGDVPKLQTAHFSYNNLTLSEHPDGSFTYSGDFFGNRSPFHQCSELEYLYLANNSISEIYYDWRVLLLKLRALDLRFNLFERLMLEDIHFLSTSISVDLSQNHISKVVLRGIDFFAMNQNTLGRKPAQITLEGNPLDCDCGLLELAQFANGGLQNEVYDLVNLALDDVQCSSPSILKGRKFTEVLPGELLCSYDLCPKDCDCWYRRYDLGMIVNCTARGLIKVPDELPNINNIHHNHTELLLDDNKITELPSQLQPGYNKVTQLFLAGNHLSTIETSIFNSNLTVLTLDHNNLTHLSKDLLKTFSNFTSLRLLTLYANPWVCDCSARDLLSWMQLRFKQISHLGNVNCSDGRPFSKLSAGELCPAPLALVLGCAVVAACGVILGTLAALYYRFNHALRVWLYARGWCLWLVTEEELDRDKRFDAFVSFSQKDEDFVVNTLVPGLENCGLKLCLHYRDWVAGEWIPTQIARSVEASRRTLVVLSPNFLDSVWGRLEFRAAHKQALSEGRARVVMLIYGDVPPANELDPELRAYISVNTYVKWGDPWFWDKLRYALPHAPLPKSKKKVDDHLELIRPMDSPVNSPSTPPALPLIPNVIFSQSVLQTPKDCVIPAVS